MKIKRILSFILAAALVLSCAPSYLPTAEAAAEATPTVIYTAGDLGVENAVVVESFDAALAVVEAKNKQWKSNDIVEIRFRGDVSGGSQDGLLFGLTTIWREDGTKLPIILRGVDTKMQGDAYIYLDGAGGWYACANDYSFINLTLPIGAQATDFYAGSGNITFESVNFKKNTSPLQTEQDQTDKYRYSLEVAEAICSDRDNLIDPDVFRVPVGDAWQIIRDLDKENGTNYGQGLCGTKALGFWGDGGHDGDTGGGQYLGACVYFETMTGISCVGNAWRPTDYELSEELVTLLQYAAHKAVSDIYGEEHYTGWSDKVGNDNEWNVLLLGSSNCYYLRDELQAIAEYSGIDTRVFHAYSSGILMQKQYDWMVNNNGKYHTYNIADGTTTDAVDQNITDFLNDYAWDSIITYQNGGAFDNDLPYSEEGLQIALDSCDKADEFYNYIYESHSGADYYWYQAPAGPYGAPETEGFQGRIFADTCTQAVFAGWDELESGEKVNTSVTFGDGLNFKDNATTRVAAVGYLETAPDTAFNAMTAAAVKYPEANDYDNVADIRPLDVKASIIVDGAETTLGRVCCKLGYAPSAGSVIMRNGTVFKINSTNPNTTNAYYGDVELELAGGTLSEQAGFINTNLTGNVKMIFSGIAVSGNITVVSANATVDGDVTLDMQDGSIDGRVYVCGNGGSGAKITGTAKFRWGGGYIKQIQTGRGTTIGTLVNEFYTNPDAKTPATTDNNFNLAGYSSCVVTGDICNNFIGQIPAGIMSRAKWYGGDGDHSKIINTVKADANGNAHTFASFCGGITAGTVKEIVNNIEAGNFTAFNGGSKIATGTTKITNNISGGTFTTNTVFGGVDNATVNTVITGGTFAFDPSANVATGYEVVENEDGTYTVENAFKPGLFVAVRPNKTVYNIGDALDTKGLVLQMIYEDGCEEYIDEGFTVTGFDSTAVGKTTVTVSYGGKTVELGLSIVDSTIEVVDDSGNVYTSVADAVEDCEENAALTLLQDAETGIAVEKDMSIDLNGKKLGGTVTVADGCTLYGADASTDDYTVDDGDGYTKIKVECLGDGKVEGMPAGLANDNYLMVTEGEYVSFHRVNLQITHMTLRSSEVGAYFKSAFAGDELVEERVKSFGIVMSLTGEPTKESMTAGTYTTFENFEAGFNFNDATSTLLKDVMKSSNPYLINKRNATIPVYGRAYALLDDGTYVFGQCVQRTFQEQVEAADAIWETLNADQKLEAVKMYCAYEKVMQIWNIPNIKAEASK